MSGQGGYRDGAVEALRLAFEQIRSAVELGSLAIPLARYDAEMVPHNYELLTQFFDDVVPVGLELPMSDRDSYEAEWGYEKTSSSFIFTNPVDIRPTSLIGVFLTVELIRPPQKLPSASFVIGSRSEGEFTRLLVATRQGRLGEDETWDSETTVYSTLVRSKDWDAHIDNAMRQIAVPYDGEQMKSGYFPEQGTAWRAHRPDNGFGLTTIATAKDKRGDTPSTPKAMRHALDQTTSVDKYIIGATEVKMHILSGDDLEEYGVLAHLYRIAAAYGRIDELDALLENWAADIPAHPAEALLKLTGYRRALGMAAVADLTPSTD